MCAACKERTRGQKKNGTRNHPNGDHPTKHYFQLERHAAEPAVRSIDRDVGPPAVSLRRTKAVMRNSNSNIEMSGPVTFGSSYQPPSREGDGEGNRRGESATRCVLSQSPIARKISPLLSSPLRCSPSFRSEFYPERIQSDSRPSTPSKEFVIKNLSPALEEAGSRQFLGEGREKVRKRGEEMAVRRFRISLNHSPNDKAERRIGHSILTCNKQRNGHFN